MPAPLPAGPRTKTRAAQVSLAVNLALTAAKLLVGLATGSASVLAEAIHSGTDLAASAVALGGVWAAGRPADAGHHYGHGKFESIAGLGEALLIAVSVGLIAVDALGALAAPGVGPAVDVGIGLMALSAVVNTAVAAWLGRVVAATGSLALAVDAAHHRADAWTSLGVFAGLFAVRLTGLAWLDPTIALGIAAFILRSAWRLGRAALDDMLDHALPAEERALVQVVLDRPQPGVVGYHALRTRRGGTHRYVDLHLVVDPGITVDAAHARCDAIEAAVRGQLPACVVTIHVEPDGAA